MRSVKCINTLLQAKDSKDKPEKDMRTMGCSIIRKRIHGKLLETLWLPSFITLQLVKLFAEDLWKPLGPRPPLLLLSTGL